MPPNTRRPNNDQELRYWLENMVVHHDFSSREVSAATGLSRKEVADALLRFGLQRTNLPTAQPGAPLRVLPYPGGRHPRIGFLDGAINPQRETKVSIFAPWDAASYVVLDVPEAIWSNLGLTYLAHTHMDTIWSAKDIHLPPLEWERRENGELFMRRLLPNGIAFATRVQPRADGVRVQLWLRNGTTEHLRSLSTQNCLMLKSAVGFEAQTLTNKVFLSPYAAVGSTSGDRWVITAFDRCQRTWGNDQVPCIHSDPAFPDLAPGESCVIQGWVWFYQGQDLQKEFERLERTDWRKPVGPEEFE